MCGVLDGTRSVRIPVIPPAGEHEIARMALAPIAAPMTGRDDKRARIAMACPPPGDWRKRDKASRNATVRRAISSRRAASVAAAVSARLLDALRPGVPGGDRR